MRKLIAGAVAAIAVAAASGSAQAAVFAFNTNNGLNQSGTDTYSLTVDGITVLVKAYNGIFGTVNLANQVDVTWSNGNGLGAAGYGDNQLNTCQQNCDGQPGEGLLLDFGRVVTLSQAQFSAWTRANPETNLGNGDDGDYAFGNPVASGALAAITGVSVANSIATWNTNLTGQQFFLAARHLNNDNQDKFWLRGVTVAAAVPEPATWAMMITGFGLAGLQIRRRNKLALA